jgi:hypothetical protein
MIEETIVSGDEDSLSIGTLLENMDVGPFTRDFEGKA